MQPTSMVGVWKTVKRMNNEYLFGTLIPHNVDNKLVTKSGE
jgi:hypothetical protein